jgi:hypothetical protein
MISLDVDNLNTTQALEYTKDKYNVKIIKRKVSPHQQPMSAEGWKEERSEVDRWVIRIKTRCQ